MHRALIRTVADNISIFDRLTIANTMLSLLGSTLSDPFAPHLKQAPPQSANRKTRREKEDIEIDLQNEDEDPDIGSNVHVEAGDVFSLLGRGTDRLIESVIKQPDPDVGMAPTANSVKTHNDGKAAKAEKRRKRKEEKAKTKKAVVEREASGKERRKEKAQS